MPKKGRRKQNGSEPRMMAMMRMSRTVHLSYMTKFTCRVLSWRHTVLDGLLQRFQISRRFRCAQKQLPQIERKQRQGRNFSADAPQQESVRLRHIDSPRGGYGASIAKAWHKRARFCVHVRD